MAESATPLIISATVFNTELQDLYFLQFLDPDFMEIKVSAKTQSKNIDVIYKLNSKRSFFENIVYTYTWIE